MATTFLFKDDRGILGRASEQVIYANLLMFKSFEFDNYERMALGIYYKEYESNRDLLQDQIAVDEMEISIVAWRMSTGHFTSVSPATK